MEKTRIKLKEQRCRVCNRLNDATFVKEENMPKPGHFAVCFYCGSIGIFDDSLTIAPATPEQLVELYMIDENAYNHVMRMQRIIISPEHQAGLKKITDQSPDPPMSARD